MKTAFHRKTDPVHKQVGNPVVFKQLQLTCFVKAKAFIMCTYKQHRLGYRTACWHFRSVFEGLTLKQPHIDHMLGRIRGRSGFFGASSALLLHCSLALRAPATNILFDNRRFHHVHMHSASSAQVVSAHNSCASPSMLLQLPFRGPLSLKPLTPGCRSLGALLSLRAIGSSE